MNLGRTELNELGRGLFPVNLWFCNEQQGFESQSLQASHPSAIPVLNIRRSIYRMKTQSLNLRHFWDIFDRFLSQFTLFFVTFAMVSWSFIELTKPSFGGQFYDNLVWFPLNWFWFLEGKKRLNFFWENNNIKHILFKNFYKFYYFLSKNMYQKLGEFWTKLGRFESRFGTDSRSRWISF